MRDLQDGLEAEDERGVRRRRHEVQDDLGHRGRSRGDRQRGRRRRDAAARRGRLRLARPRDDGGAPLAQDHLRCRHIAQGGEAEILMGPMLNVNMMFPHTEGGKVDIGREVV